MSSLVTAEEMGQAWLEDYPDDPASAVVEVLMHRISEIRDAWISALAAHAEAAEEVSNLRSDFREEVDRLVAVRLHEVRSCTSALLQAASNFAVAVDEEWR